MPLPVVTLDMLFRIRVPDQLVLAYQPKNWQAANQLCICLDEHNYGSLIQINIVIHHLLDPYISNYFLPKCEWHI